MCKLIRNTGATYADLCSTFSLIFCQAPNTAWCVAGSKVSTSDGVILLQSSSINTRCCLCTVGRFPRCSVVLECGVVSAESTNAHPYVLSSAVAGRVLFALPLQSTSCSALQGTPVAAASSGQ